MAANAVRMCAATYNCHEGKWCTDAGDGNAERRVVQGGYASARRARNAWERHVQVGEAHLNGRLY